MIYSHVISVTCKNDNHLHLALVERGLGASVHTLCLEKWTKREDCHTDSVLCPKCVEKWKEKNPQ